MATFLFIVLAVITVVAVVGMILSRHQAHNALLLAVAFAALGGLFALLNAPFVAVIQIIIYAGAIMVLFIFVIMMIDFRQPTPPLKKRWVYCFGIILITIVMIELILVIVSLPKADSLAGNDFGQPQALGQLLFTKYLYAFEITSILIVAALVGSLYLARKREKS